MIHALHCTSGTEYNQYVMQFVYNCKLQVVLKNPIVYIYILYRKKYQIGDVSYQDVKKEIFNICIITKVNSSYRCILA